MTRINKILALIGVVLFCLLTSWVSEADYNHTIVGNMPESEYEEILVKMAEAGDSEPSEAEIVEWWEKHH